MTELATKEDRTDTIEISLVRSEGLPDLLENERVREGLSDIDQLSKLPMQLIEKYSELAVRHATLQRYSDGEWFAKIPGFTGVWAKERSIERTLEVLKEVVQDWTLLKIEHKDHDLPVVEEIDLNVL